MESLSDPPPNERFIGCLLGQAIGDALGMPVAGRSRQEIAAEHGRVTTYLPLLDSRGHEVAQAGQVSANTELALCLLETIVSSNGFVVPETAGFRMIQLLDSEHAHFLGTTTRRALQQSRETWDFQAGIGGPDSAGVGAAARIAPVGLAHALGRLNTELLVREVLRSSLLTHAHPEAVNGALAIAYALNLIVRDGLPANMLPAEVASFIDEDAVARQVRLAESLLRQRSGPRDDMDALARIGTSGYVAEAVAAAVYLVGAYGADVEGALITAVNAGGATDATGAMTGALCGAIVGARALPERLVEGLESRMYILMAAPALYRTAQRRAGLFLQLHQRP